MDARDFIRGTRPWAQFLTYANYVAEVDGSALWAAQLNDERFLPAIRARLKEMAKEGVEARPPLAGYSREVDGLHRVATELRMLRAEIGRWGVAPPIPGPLFPSEKLKREEQAQEVNDLQAAVAMGHQNWREANARVLSR